MDIEILTYAIFHEWLILFPSAVRDSPEYRREQLANLRSRRSGGTPGMAADPGAASRQRQPPRLREGSDRL